MFTWHRFLAVLHKEFVQMRRDRLTFAMMIGVPIMQLVLFGYAINMDPKGLPAAVVAAEQSPFARSFVRSLENSGYFRVIAQPRTVDESDALLAAGKIQFAIHLPEDFGRRIQRGERPVVLVEADATDPAATGTRSRRCKPSTSPRSIATSWDRSRRSARAPRPSSCASTGATTRRTTRSTTSCPG